MKSHISYLRYTWFLLVMVFAVIIAGGVVRMTQSGMGCPDWPRCFGRWIPPTQASELPADYEKYLSKQDIDHSFNAYHTWIEYINRLFGALLGFVIIIHLIWSYRVFWKTDRRIVTWSFLLLILTGFQAWLGKKVVDHNLAAVKITTHMLVALVIGAIPLLIIYRIKTKERVIAPVLKTLSVIVLLVILVQVVLGTQVREQVDEISRSLMYTQRDLWMGRLDKTTEFFIHRSFSWLVIAGCLLLFWKARPYPSLRNNATLIVVLAIMAMVVGITMAKFSIPAIAQPLHLLIGSILVLAVFSLRLRLK